MAQSKLKIISDIEFFDKYGITIPKNKTERDIEIWNQLALTQEIIRTGATQKEVYIRLDCIKDYIIDTQHVSVPMFSKN